jgi:hypothetical protein
MRDWYDEVRGSRRMVQDAGGAYLLTELEQKLLVTARRCDGCRTTGSRRAEAFNVHNTVRSSSPVSHATSVQLS